MRLTDAYPTAYVYDRALANCKIKLFSSRLCDKSHSAMELPLSLGSRKDFSAIANHLPLVSVIMPVFNGANTVRGAIDSVLAQSFTDYEFIIVDDASTDNSAEIIESYGNRVRYIRRTVNSGLCGTPRYDARKVAVGRYLAYIDQDDTWEPDKLERQITFMENHPEFPLSHTYAWIIDKTGQHTGIRHEGNIPPSGRCAGQLLDHCFVTSSTMVIRRTFQLDDRYPNPPSSSNADLMFLFAVLQNAPAGIGFLPVPLSSYRKWSGNMSRQWKWGKVDVSGLDLLFRSGLWRGLVPRSKIRRAISRAYVINAEDCRYSGMFRRAFFFIFRGLLRAPLNCQLHACLLKTSIQTSTTCLGASFRRRHQ